MGEIISQSKIYIDFSEGNLQLTRVKSVDVTDEKDVEIVKAVGVEGGAGYRHQTGGGELTLEVYREDVPEVDYRALERRKEAFAMTFQDEAGTREQYQGCKVANVGRKDDEQGNHMDSIKVKFLRRVDL